LALLRLITSSNLEGCWTGRSEGFMPLSNRPTYWEPNSLSASDVSASRPCFQTEDVINNLLSLFGA
jgi:hypothetical protein